jgi:chromosome segregation ATPase
MRRAPSFLGICRMLILLLPLLGSACDDDDRVKIPKINGKVEVEEVRRTTVKVELAAAEQKLADVRLRGASLKAQIDELRKRLVAFDQASHRGEATADRLTKESGKYRRDLSELDKQILELRDLIIAGKPVSLGGRVRTVAELEQEAAQGLDVQRPALLATIAHTEEMAQLAGDNGSLDRREFGKRQAKVNELERRLDQISEMGRFLAVRVNDARAAGGTSLSIADDLKKLEREINSVSDELSGTRRVAQSTLDRDTRVEDWRARNTVDRPVADRIKEQLLDSAPTTKPATN